MEEQQMRQQMKQVGRYVGLRMSPILGFCLSFVNVFFSSIVRLYSVLRYSMGSPGIVLRQLIPITVSLIISFAISTALALLIGLVVPVGRISMAVEKGKPRTVGTLLSSLITDLIYTPVISLVMAPMGLVMMIVSQLRMTKDPAFVSMLLRNYMNAGRIAWMFVVFLITFAIAFALIFFLQPVFRKRAFRKYGITMENEV